VVGAVAAYSGLHSARQKVFDHARATTVYVVRTAVPRDETAADAYAQGRIVATPMPVRYAPTDAVTDLPAIGRRVAAEDLAAGEVVVHGMFVSATDNPGEAARSVPVGDVAVSVAVSRAAGVAGMIEPGDTVDILLDLKGGYETYLFRAVPVLAVGTTLVPSPASAPSAPAGTAPVASDLVTFSVTPAVAAHIPPARSGAGGVTQGIYLALDARGTTAGQGTTLYPGSSLIPGFATPTTTTTPPTHESSTGGGSGHGGGGELVP